MYVREVRGAEPAPTESAPIIKKMPRTYAVVVNAVEAVKYKVVTEVMLKIGEIRVKAIRRMKMGEEIESSRRLASMSIKRK